MFGEIDPCLWKFINYPIELEIHSYKWGECPHIIGMRFLSVRLPALFNHEKIVIYTVRGLKL